MVEPNVPDLDGDRLMLEAHVVDLEGLHRGLLRPAIRRLVGAPPMRSSGRAGRTSGARWSVRSTTWFAGAERVREPDLPVGGGQTGQPPVGLGDVDPHQQEPEDRDPSQTPISREEVDLGDLLGGSDEGRSVNGPCPKWRL